MYLGDVVFIFGVILCSLGPLDEEIHVSRASHEWTFFPPTTTTLTAKTGNQS